MTIAVMMMGSDHDDDSGDGDDDSVVPDSQPSTLTHELNLAVAASNRPVRDLNGGLGAAEQKVRQAPQQDGRVGGAGAVDLLDG